MPEPQSPSERDERNLVGAMLIETEAAAKGASLLRSTDLAGGRYRAIFEAIASVIATGKRVDFVTVSEALEEKGHLAKIGGSAFLTTLTNETATAAHVETFAKKVQRASKTRSQIRLLQGALRECQDPLYDPDAGAGKLVGALTKRTDASPLLHGLDLMMAIDRDAEMDHPVIKTGTPTLDKMLTDFNEGAVALITAPPGTGKTAMGVQVLITEILAGGWGVMFSAEMSALSVAYRMIAHETGISRRDIWQGALDEDGWKRFAFATNQIANLKERITIDETSNIPLDLLIARAHMMDMRARQARDDGKGLSVVVIDYLQLIRSEGDSMEERVSHASQELLALAKHLHTRVLVVANLAKDGTTRYSGQADFDADVKVQLEKAPDNDPEHLVANVTKQRDGETGKLDLRYIGKMYRYYDWDTAPFPDAPPDRSQGRRVAEERTREG